MTNQNIERLTFAAKMVRAIWMALMWITWVFGG
jgi:hypothetical protein